MSTLDKTKSYRNHLICQLWGALREIRDILGDEMTEEDMNLWTLVTNHSAVQDRLDHAFALEKEIKQTKAETSLRIQEFAPGERPFGSWIFEHGRAVEREWQAIKDEYGDAGPLLTDFQQQRWQEAMAAEKREHERE
jgi:hypothetical protein